MYLFSLFLTLSHLILASSSGDVDFDQWQHGRVRVNGTSIHFRYTGTGPPLLLVHGNPQHSLTWRVVGPLLADKYTVIAPDNRGMGDSLLAPDGDYSSEAMSRDLKGLLDYLDIRSTFIFAHDKGCGPATALASQYPQMVKALVLGEYVLPGFGYEEFWSPNHDWDINSNWQLAFFSIPDLADAFIRGREKELLTWYFYHASYAGSGVIPEYVLDRYVTSIQKPGFLRAMLQPFAAHTVKADNDFFNRTVRSKPLQMPVMALGGEASFAPVSVLEGLWGQVADNITYDIIPRAGHWFADENPEWVAARIHAFFTDTQEFVPAVDIDSLI